MNDASAIYTVSILIVTLVAGLLYIRLWRARAPDRTPTGFGALLAFVALGGGVAAGASASKILALAALCLGTIVYWIDDAVELPARARMIIAMLIGMVVGGLLIVDSGSPSLASWIAICLAAGATCVILTNVVNFYDGADLNLALYIAMTCALVLLFRPEASSWTPIASACLAFVLPFAALNSRPRTIYLGDGGSFAFAGLLTAIGTAFVLAPSSVPPEAAIPSALPALDVAYVFAVRVASGHDLLSRNWLHLYQQLNLRWRGFGYLAPQLVNVALCVVVSSGLQQLGLEKLTAIIWAGALVTISFYFACRALFVPNESVIDPTAGE